MATTTDKVIGISELVVSADPRDVLVTYSLGSCVGLAMWDSKVKVGGLLHAMMPLSSADPQKAAANPAMYTDTGVAALLQAMFDRGATRGTLVARVAGASSSMDGSGLFRIGERNEMVLRRLLWKNDILIASSDCGGSASRTMVLEVGTGRVYLKTGGTIVEL